MAYTVRAAGTTGNLTYSVNNLLQLLGSNDPPQQIAFPLLGNPAAHTTNLGVNQGAPIHWEATTQAVVRSQGLITCASVCYVNSDTGIGYVYHANAGSIGQSAFESAMSSIDADAPYKRVSVAFAHPGNSDSGYQSSINDLVTWGIPKNQIVEITNLLVPAFGLNNSLQLGY